VSIVIFGADGYDGLFKVVLKSAGQFAEVVMALGDLSPEPPVGAALVVEVDVLLVVVVEVDLVERLPSAIQYEMPTTMAATTTTLMTRRRLRLRFRVFS
jgi:hypothetical protein